MNAQLGNETPIEHFRRCGPKCIHVRHCSQCELGAVCSRHATFADSFSWATTTSDDESEEQLRRAKERIAELEKELLSMEAHLRLSVATTERLFEQRKAACAERDEARAEVERLRKLVEPYWHIRSLVLKPADEFTAADREWLEDWITDCMDELSPNPTLREMTERHRTRAKKPSHPVERVTDSSPCKCGHARNNHTATEPVECVVAGCACKEFHWDEEAPETVGVTGGAA